MDDTLVIDERTRRRFVVFDPQLFALIVEAAVTSADHPALPNPQIVGPRAANGQPVRG